jgi:signal transduction histidine kinase
VARIRIGGLRARLTVTVGVVVAIALAAVALVYNAVLDSRLSSDANGLLSSRVDAELGALSTAGGRLRVRESPDDAALDTELWVFRGRSELERPNVSSATTERAVSRLAGGPRRTAEPPGTHRRLLAVPVESGGRRLGTVLAGVSLKPYERARHVALVASLILCGAVLTVVLLMARWVVVRALRPVSRMTAQAAAWSEADLERRFELGGPHDELTQLAATLDGLLDRLAAAMRHEQRFSAEISHELRTPLAKIRAEAEIALRRRRTPAAYRDALSTVLRTAERMSAVVETLVVAARAEAEAGHATSDAVAAAVIAADTCRELAERRGVTVTVNGTPRPVRVAADEDVVERILFPLIENGCRYATRAVTVHVERGDRRALIRVLDDGPGVARDEVETIFSPGERGRAADADSPGAGLGLPLARRLARQVGGEIVAEPGDGGRFTVELPRSDTRT